MTARRDATFSTHDFFASTTPRKRKATRIVHGLNVRMTMPFAITRCGCGRNCLPVTPVSLAILILAKAVHLGFGWTNAI